MIRCQHPTKAIRLKSNTSSRAICCALPALCLALASSTPRAKPPRWSLVTDRVLSSGTVAGSLTFITDLAVSRVGTVLVLDGPSKTIFIIDSTGRMMGRAGRRGGGPGEFQEVSAL